ncbi:hypothetical protein FR932_12215 [Moritella marina ATCC 15381]|uniref:Uncharacterized protein n=1 Tax=Moritella marina ATCC 15381 TaxID=1202962 RepID=A0A5J6WNL7_MORMI|nr:hypothetical protein [Moritella marina]QFI38560.1 hypothetical protein FR932_12215 [Moritella marina ATCC 15381]
MIKIIALIMIGLLAPVSSVLANGGPPDSGIKSVKVYTHSGISSSAIYNNGLMQAAINVVYELADGYTLGEVELKHLYTGAALDNWAVTEKGNDFLHDINAVRSPRSAASPSSASYKTLYLSTKSNHDASICVELTASKDGSTSKFSTCEGDTSYGSVYLNVHVKKTYTLMDDFVVTKKDSGWVNSTFNISKRYTAQGFNLHSVDYNGAHRQPGSNKKYLIGSSSLAKGTLGNDAINSAFYLYAPNQGGITDSFPLYNHHQTPTSWSEGRSEIYNINTTNSLVFSLLVGRGNSYIDGDGKERMHDGVFLYRQLKPDHLNKDIYFYDSYGNKGEISIARKTSWGYRYGDYSIF